MIMGNMLLRALVDLEILDDEMEYIELLLVGRPGAHESVKDHKELYIGYLYSLMVFNELVVGLYGNLVLELLQLI